MGLHFIEGNEAIAWAAYEAGCRFFAGYPITPATGIYDAMLKILPPGGGVVLQAEDEIAAIGSCIGASMAGSKAMTATSGPGISLYSENISFAVGSEIPLVIVDVQRLGPSTGAATRGADGDIQFMRWGNSSGLPVIVLSPVDVTDCFKLTLSAFNLAETYRCPVFIASNKEVGQTRESVDLDIIDRPQAFDRLEPLEKSPFLPFKALPGKDVPGFLPIGGEYVVRQTSSMHGPDGYITLDPDEILNLVERLNRKILNDVDLFSYSDEIIDPSAETMILCYGVTARAARTACKKLKEEGMPVSLLILKTLWPVPENLIKDMTRTIKRIIVIEMNLGQYTREIKRILPEKEVEYLWQMNGYLITPDQIQGVVHG
jgi:2-oxoglutarate ferredoxin oxidoreductase subunit alpha